MNNKNNNKDINFGIVKTIKNEKAFGFIYCKSHNCDYYFRLNQYNSTLKIGDEVVFSIKQNEKNTLAYKVQKVFKNRAGDCFIDRAGKSHIHINDENILLLILDRIVDYNKEYSTNEVEFPCVIGQTNCVLTDINDEIVYAVREGRSGYTRLVKHRSPVDSKFATISLMKVEDLYIILTAFIGKTPGLEPWDIRATESDLKSWENRALIYEGETLIENTETSINPWVLNQ